LFFISAELELFVQRTLGHSSVAIVILDLFLAFWSYVLGLGLLLFLSVWCLVRWCRERVTRLAISRYAPAEPRSRGLEKPEQDVHQYLQLGIATGPMGSIRAGENERHGLTRAA
jgi:hypothetical protein